MHCCTLRSDREQELCENGAAALFPCTASAGGWLRFQRDPECQVWSLDLGLVDVRKRDRPFVRWEALDDELGEGVGKGLVGFFNLMIAHRCQNFTAGQVKRSGNTPR